MKHKVLTVLCLGILINVTYGQWKDKRKRKNDEALFPEWHTIELPLNYFDALDNRTFTARYLTNDQFYKKGGPMIVYVGGEWEIQDYGVMGGVAFQLARKHNGYLHYPEHRYFGKSSPYPGSVSADNMKYITPDYSLADLVYTIANLKSTVKSLQDSQVILIGGSYAGALATWARLKYPHIISAAYACGGVIDTTAENRVYEQVFYDVYKKESPECLNVLLAGMEKVERMYRSKNGRKKLYTLFDSHDNCRTFSKRFDVRQQILDVFNAQVWPVEKVGMVCEYLLNKTTGTLVNRLLQTKNEFKGDEPCENIEQQWNYLACSFIGNIQTSSPSNFGNLSTFSQQVERMCIGSFDSRFTEEFVKEHTQRISLLYGDTTIDITKVLSVQGTHDPWRYNSITDDLNDDTPVIFIEGANHCLELGEEQENESPQVLQSKFEILEQLSQWIR